MTVFTIFGYFLWRTFKIKLLEIHLLILKILPVTLFVSCLRMYRKYRPNFIVFKKNTHLVTQSLSAFQGWKHRLWFWVLYLAYQLQWGVGWPLPLPAGQHVCSPPGFCIILYSEIKQRAEVDIKISIFSVFDAKCMFFVIIWTLVFVFALNCFRLAERQRNLRDL